MIDIQPIQPQNTLPELLGPSPMQIQHYLDNGLCEIENAQPPRAYIGISGAADCRRSQWFGAVRGMDPSRYPLPPHPPHKMRLFRDGHVYEEELLYRLTKAGLPVTDMQREVTWPHPELQDTVKGHMDGRIVVPTNHGPVWTVVECKRVGGTQSLKRSGSVVVAWPHMVWQLTGYMHCSQSPLGLLLISDKSDREMAVYEAWFQVQDGVCYDLASGQPAVHVAEIEERLIEVEMARRSDQPPARDYDPRGKDWQCRYCDNKEYCLELGR